MADGLTKAGCPKNIKKSRKSRKSHGLGCFLLSKVRNLKEIEWFGLFFVINSQVTQGNRMVRAVFLSKARKLNEKNRLGSFPLSEVRNLKEYNGVGWFVSSLAVGL